MKALFEDPSFATLVQDFFCCRLQQQRGASPHTIASYRDTFRLLLHFAERSLGRTPTRLTLADLDAPFVLAFLDHLEGKRKNSVRTRNTRLAAIRSFCRYSAYRAPASLAQLHQVLAIPSKRFDQPEVGYLTRAQVSALLAAPDASTWSGQRDRVLFQILYNTGARVSEVVGMNMGDIDLSNSACAHLHGKGRKERTVPLWKTTGTALRRWTRNQIGDPGAPLFPDRRGERLTRSGVQARLNVAVERAVENCPSLPRRVTPHVLRHTTAMHLLQAGVDIAVIALWLGHESTATTHRYLASDLEMKRRTLGKLPDIHNGGARFRPDDRLLAFLDAL